MSFIRPEAAATLKLVAEPVIYGAAGIFFGVRAIQLLATGAWTGAVLAAISLLSIFAFYGAVRRARYRVRFREPGPGVVSVHEGRILYMGPFGGASIARDALIEVALDVDASGAVTWVLTDEARVTAQIPGAARDAALLLDVLGPLTGFDHAALDTAMGARRAGRVTVWHRWPGQMIDQ